jgi:hypothetical protein
MIARNTVLTFDVQGTTGQWIPRTIAGIRQDAINGLAPFVDAQDVEVSAPGFLSDPVHSLTNWPYSAVVRARVLADYRDVRDVDSIVAHAFYTAAGDLPTVTARRLEAGQGEAGTTTGPGLGTLFAGSALVVIALVAIAVVAIKTL